MALNKHLLPLFFLLCLLFPGTGRSQFISKSKAWIEWLCSDSLYGRGYVNQGVNRAADQLIQCFDSIGLQPVAPEYVQHFQFPIVSYASPIRLSIDDRMLKTGIDYLIEAGSPSVNHEFALRHINMKDSMERFRLFNQIRQGIPDDTVWVLHHYKLRKSAVYDSLRQYQRTPALVVATEDQKMTHGLEQTLRRYPALTIMDSVMGSATRIKLQYDAMEEKSFECRNLVGFFPGLRHDSAIVFTAHYDHLGMLGPGAMFPGASDNASGVSMVLQLASYYKKHRPPMDMYFILFSGEEAGLMGSHYFVQHPLFDLKKIKLLMNLDIMGDAEKGIVIVNGVERKEEAELFSTLNEQLELLPEVRFRTNARNSDHYYFTEAGVPAVFIYSNGGPGFYHDVFDLPENLSMKNYRKVFILLKSVVSELAKQGR